MKSSTELRAAFLDYFARQGHRVLPSGPLVPANDPTLLFTNAGMVQFKDVFLGREPAPHPRVATSQRCVRAGGKHNDLENVGYTARHHTFFEMLGNFSFGDYFKREAIRYAWEFLTEVLKIPPARLWVTVYKDDDEAADIWLKEMKVDPRRFSRCGDEDNFWAMGDTGPCGPCTEIFFDHGEGIAGGPPGSGEDGDRYVEIWNLVFTQYDRTADGVLYPIPHPSVDTGMGLERLAAVMQGVHSNYDIDLFQNLIKAAAHQIGTRDLTSPSLKVIADHIRACSFLICDGVIPSNEGRGYVLRRIIRRAIRHGYKLGQQQPFFYELVTNVVETMGDAYPELMKNAGRISEVLKQEEERFGETLVSGMLRFETAAKVESRAISYVRSHLISNFKFFEELAGANQSVRFDGVFHRDDEDVVIEVKKLSDSSNLEEFSRRFVNNVKLYEREKNKPTRGYAIFVGKSQQAPEELIDITNPHRNNDGKEKIKFRYLNQNALPLDGKDAFQLYDTFGFPLDLTRDLCREKGIQLDEAGFEAAMEQQRERARAASQFSMAGAETAIPADLLAPLAPGFQFTGYDTLNDKAVIRALFAGSKPVKTLAAGATGVVVLDRTPFYAEAGGQVGDRGRLRAADAVFEVADTRKQSGVHLHIGTLKLGRLRVGDKVEADVDPQHRQPTRLNHSATHLLHAALRWLLGGHVTQKGSLVAPDRLRFDFSHSEPVSAEQCREIEQLVNAEVRANREVQTRVMPIQKAMESGAMALFGEKYDDDVRVLRMGEFSVELCGGTHVARTGDIGLFKIIAETGVAAGVRRIEALTGEAALNWVAETEARLKAVADQLKANRDNVTERVEQLLERGRQQDRDMQALKGKLASGTGADLGAQAVTVGGVKVLAACLDSGDAATLRDTVDQLKNKLGSAAVVLAAVEEGKVRLIAGVTKDLTGKVPAGELVNQVARQVGGKGGGRPDMAQAGGTDPANLEAALQSVVPWVRSRLGA